MPPVSEDPESHNDPPAGSEDAELHDDPSPWWQHIDWRPPGESGEMLQVEPSGTTGLSTSSSEIPPLHDDMPLQHTNWHPPEEMLQGETESLGTSSTTSGAPQLQNHLPPAPGTPPVHSDGSGKDDDLWLWHHDSRVNEGASSSSDINSEVPLTSEARPPSPEVDKVFTDALKKKIQAIAEFGVVAGGSVVFTLAVQKVIQKIKNETNKNETYVSAFFPLLPTSNRVTNILTYDLAQSTHWHGSCK